VKNEGWEKRGDGPILIAVRRVNVFRLPRRTWCNGEGRSDTLTDISVAVGPPTAVTCGFSCRTVRSGVVQQVRERLSHAVLKHTGEYSVSVSQKLSCGEKIE